MTALKQIRKFCFYCCGGSTKFIRYCSDTECPLWYLRFGMSPKAYIRKNGDNSESLFDKVNFKIGEKYSPDKLAERMGAKT